MVCGHGSRSPSASREFAAFVHKLSPLLAPYPVEYGYLEFATPIISDGLDRLRRAGVNDILAVPCMLFAAGHVKNDIPSVLREYAARHGVQIRYGRDLGLDSKMVVAAASRISAAIDEADAKHGAVPLEATCLVVIGRGASDPDANANVAKMARLLLETLGLGWVEVGYSGVTFPLVTPCLEATSRLGFKRVVVFPYFLFSGILIDRIYGFTREVAAQNPKTQFITAGYLGDHPLVLEVVGDRVRGISEGDTAMNCSLCKYRVPLPGFADEIGLPQHSHHHHVEGKGGAAYGCDVATCDLCGDFCTGACRLTDQAQTHAHDHHHHHHPYPHAKHPLGPSSVLGKKHKG
ncbi:MAG: sirohydrochlorin chelatase [Proteobacteria bacterium]|nr:sirohydrochlorin chelatase [Pseudomonadota bacterium]